MKDRFLINIINLLFLSSVCFSIAKDKIYVVTTTQDLAEFVSVIGKDKVEVISLTYGWQDPHRVELKPSMVAHIRKSDLVIKIGMDLDSWVDDLILMSGNNKVVYGQVGYLDVSQRIKKLEVPEGKVDARMGEVHIFGNPHYWLSPENAKIIVEDITERLSILMPKNKNYFIENKDRYLKLLDEKISIWKQKIEKLTNKKVVSYHKTFAYFFDCFGLKEIITLEPKPGIPPSAKYLSKVIEKLKEEKPVVILHENFYPKKHTEFVSKSTQVRYEVVAVSVGGKKDIKDYITLIDNLVEAICK
ncbi:MAG: metal ABC transporter substrate-binding protein [Endomicrobiia bacterium]